MQLTVDIPDDIASRLSATGVDLSRRALESFAIEELKSGRITERELKRLLGFGTRWQLDGFLKAHGVFDDYGAKRRRVLVANCRSGTYLDFSPELLTS
jgi:Uncharacterised protein family (UPF0175)